jgi:dihydrolipoamide dehydrogenase
MTTQADIVIIGAGPGGYVAAIRAAQLGFKVICVDKRATLGGTCLNVGCIPSKTLLALSKKYSDIKNAAEWGIYADNPRINLAEVLRFKDKVIKDLVNGIQFLFKKNQISFIQGVAQIKSAGNVVITKPSGQIELVETKHIIIASGSVASEIPGIAVDETQIVTSTGALDFQIVPKDLLVVGGGYIGLEMASIWCRLGSNVTVVEYGERLLPTMDNEAALLLQKELSEQGIKFVLGHKFSGAAITDSGRRSIALHSVKGDSQSTLEVDAVLIAVGRRPCTEGLGLAELGVQTNERGFISVDEHYQTSVTGIYAIGDVIPGPMLAHKAEEEGVVVVEQLAGFKSHVNYEAIPAVVYTSPEVASVGATEEALKAANIAYVVGKFPLSANSRAKSVGINKGFVKILATPKTYRILGAHIVAPDAGTMISELALAMEYKASAEDIALTCHAHPTYGEAVKEAALAVMGRAIHV